MKKFIVTKSRYCAIRGGIHTDETIEAVNDEEAKKIFKEEYSNGYSDFKMHDENCEMIAYSNAHLCG